MRVAVILPLAFSLLCFSSGLKEHDRTDPLAPVSNESDSVFNNASSVTPRRALVRRESEGSDDLDSSAFEGLGQLLVSSGTKESSADLVEVSQSSDAIHLCTAVANEGPLAEFEFFLSSLLKQNAGKQVVYHIQTDVATTEALQKLLKEHSVTYELHVMNITVVREQAIAMKLDVWQHWAGHIGLVWPLSRIFVQDMFPNVAKCISHDTDMFVAHPITELWHVFDSMEDTQVMAGVWRPKLKFGNHINAGTTLLHFERLRRDPWKRALKNAYKTCASGGSKARKDGITEVRYPEQEIWEATLQALSSVKFGGPEKPPALYELNRSWNLEFCTNAETPNEFYGLCKDNPGQLFFGMLHFNCLSDGFLENPWYKSSGWKQWMKHGGNKCLSSFMKTP